MIIAVMSDVHDQIENLAKALDRCENASRLIFCGDFCAPFILDQLGAGFQGQIDGVFGNNDGDRFLLSQVASHYNHVTLHGEYARLKIDGLKIAVNHYPEIASDVAASRRYDAVFYGHNHEHRIEERAHCVLANPGEIMGRFGAPTFILFDTASRKCETIALD